MDNFIKINDITSKNHKLEKIFNREYELKYIIKESKDKILLNSALIELEVINSLRLVIDPELGINIFDLGLIYDFKIEENVLFVEYTLTTIGCPLGNYIENKIIEMVNEKKEFKNVITNLVFEPLWNMNDLPYETKLRLNFL